MFAFLVFENRSGEALLNNAEILFHLVTHLASRHTKFPGSWPGNFVIKEKRFNSKLKWNY